MPRPLIPLWFLIASFGLQATDAPSETLAWTDGTRYVGGVKNQMREGQGTIYWQHGARYIGGFKADLRHGPGMMIMPDGTTYKGNFLSGQLVISEEENTKQKTSRAQQIPQLSASDQKDLKSTLDFWSTAWANQNPDQYLSIYSTHFVLPSDKSRSGWEMEQREKILEPGYIQIDLYYEEFSPVSKRIVDVRVRQAYRSDTYREISNKVMRMQKEAQTWRIIGEIEG